ncbi:MAG: hypothetical protein ABIV25_07475, partial [Paracoccaceae bacterium]
MNSLPPQLGLAVTWITDPADIDTLRDEWQALAERVRADIYMRPDWFAVWWDHFSVGRRFACLVARADDSLVGVLPFVLEDVWLGPFPQSVARLAGTDPHCIILQLSLQARWADKVLAEAVNHLIGKLGCVAVSFTPISDLAAHLAPLRGLADCGTGRIVLEAAAGSHVVFDLPSSFEKYLALVASKRRGQFRSRVKGLQEAFGMTAERLAADS